MPYLYGDTTPFALEDNFVETLAFVVEACVSLLRVDEELEDLAARGEAARGEAAAAHERVETVSGTLTRALEAHAAEKVTAALLAASRGVLEKTRADIAAKREREVHAAQSSMTAARTRIGLALEALFARHELPGTRWTISWHAPLAGATRATARALTPFRLNVDSELDVPLTSPLVAPVRIGTLEKGLTLRLPETAGVFRSGTRMKRRSLDAWFVTEAELGPERARMILRPTDKKASPGVEITVDDMVVTICRVSEAGQPSAESMALELDDAQIARTLWDKLERELLTVAARRGRLIAATLDGKPAADVRRPAALADLIIAHVAPVVREIARRSPAGELVLKRDTGNGRREEIYVQRADLLAKIDTLRSERRSLFEVFHLGTTRDRVVYEEPSAVMEISPSQITEIPTAVA